MRSPSATRFACLLLAAMGSSCFAARSTFNEPLSPEQVAALRPGQTTAAEVVQALGAPTDVVQLGTRSAYRFDFSKKKTAGLFLIVTALAGEDTREDRVWTFFDENDVLSHVGATFASNRTEYTLPWDDPHDELHARDEAAED